MAEQGGVAGNPLTRGERWGMLWRSFLLQSVWNPRGMQGVGFCFAMLPLIRRHEGDPESRLAFLERHVGFFNTNPVFAGYVLGAAGALEAAGADGASVSTVKKGLGSPLGMAGDALFWGALRPLAGLLSAVLAMRGFIWAPVLFLVLYNVPHLAFRVRGIEAGAADGPGGAKEVTGAGLKSAVKWMRALVAFGVGIAVALAVRGAGGIETWKLAVVILFFALAYVGVRARVPAALMAAVGAVVCVLLLMAGLNGG